MRTQFSRFADSPTWPLQLLMAPFGTANGSSAHWPMRIWLGQDLWILSKHEALDHFQRFLLLFPQKLRQHIEAREITPNYLQGTQIFKDLITSPGTAELAAIGLAIWRASMTENARALDVAE